MCRNYNFGEHGSSKGQYFRQYLKPIKVNTLPIDWPSVDLAYLRLERYDTELNATLAAARTLQTAAQAKEASGDVKLLYSSERQYKLYARTLRMLPDWKDGVPRGAFRGVVTLHVGDARLFLAPAPGFDPTTGGGGPEGRQTGKMLSRRAAGQQRR